jgi:hypothetical protein
LRSAVEELGEIRQKPHGCGPAILVEAVEPHG